MTVAVSVVVPTYLRPDLLDSCLGALVRQDFTASNFEIIVTDDAVSKQTRAQVGRWAARVGPNGPCVRYLAVTGAHGPAAARNAGWRAARGEIIAFTDDDCLPDPGWLTAGLAALDSHLSGVTGRVVVPVTEPPTDYERDAANLGRSWFVTANCFYRRSALESVGGFDERFEVAWREDSDLWFRLANRGHMLVAAPDAVVVHPVRQARWGSSLAQQRKSMYNALLYKKHPGLYRQYIQPAPPWRYYLILAALLGALTAWIRGRRWAMRFSLFTWAALTLSFSARRLSDTSHSAGHVLEMLVTSALIPLLSVFWRLRGACKFRVWFL